MEKKKESTSTAIPPTAIPHKRKIILIRRAVEKKPLTDNKSRAELSAFSSQDYQSETMESVYRHRYSSNTKLRVELAYWAATLVSIYLLIIILILVHNHRLIHLSNNVLMTLLGTTTLNVLGLMAIVLKGYFGDKKQ